MASTRPTGKKCWSIWVTLRTTPCPFDSVGPALPLTKSSCWLPCSTRIKFVVLADPRQAGIDSLLRKIYEIYSDFALKNPFYSLEMPIRCELFDQNLKLALEVAEKAGTFGPGS
ncbi:trafficking protein particle complex subunit 4 isoform X2 [Microtus oregoni]|uniref:Trafficking protein particle complex subunit n=1 Tax=Microtus ochrogaster TaxID=79684 RepID=A0ABM1TZE7_MICOH|nr:trafficking protein particle complex subunit 4 isoform X2 [Microtus ochrogaster]XP_041494586.1 trafficking protein particle complex subunit 4 isoform X2 [Microtus oregoni]